jgi:hypothetical protein
MSYRIWKFQLEVTDVQEIDMPKGAKILHAGIQGTSGVYLWATVDTEAVTEKRRFRIYGTGNPTNLGKTMHEYIFTVQAPPFVWHIFEEEYDVRKGD